MADEFEELDEGAGSDLAAAFGNHYQDIYRYLARRVGVDAAPDLAAEVFRRAVENWGRYGAEHGAIRPWLFGIAANVWREHMRSRHRFQRALSRFRVGPRPDALSDAIDRLQAEALGPMLMQALQCVRRADREVLLLYAWEDLSYEEIANALTIPIGTVRSRLHRARTQLRELLAGTGQEVSEITRRTPAPSPLEEPTDG